MSRGFTIAISGKGGVGKTNIAALLVRHLSPRGSVLAIDADPDSNLPQALGMAVERSVGQTREDILNAPTRSPIAQDKPEALKLEVADAIPEEVYEKIATEEDATDPVQLKEFLRQRKHPIVEKYWKKGEPVLLQVPLPGEDRP